MGMHEKIAPNATYLAWYLGIPLVANAPRYTFLENSFHVQNLPCKLGLGLGC